MLSTHRSNARNLRAMGMIVAAAASASAEPTFRLIDQPFEGRRLSRDGRVALGRDEQAVYPRVTRIVFSTGEYRVLSEEESVGDGINADGSVVLAMWHRWTQPTGWFALGPLPPGASLMRGVGISDDGRFVVGGTGNYCAVWTPASGVTIIPNVSGEQLRGMAQAVNADGRVLVGYATERQFPEFYPFRWTNPATGGAGVQWISELPTGRHGGSSTEVSEDGSVVVGSCKFVYPHSQAFRWTDPAAGGSGMQPLGFLPGTHTSYASATDAAGDIVVGYASGPELYDEKAFVWTPSQGMVSAQRWLADRGLPQVLSIDLAEVRDISADGRTLIGILREAGATIHTWVATVDSVYCPVDFNHDWVVDFSDYLQFLNFYDIRDLRADLNRDGVIDFTDYLEFLNRFDAGC